MKRAKQTTERLRLLLRRERDRGAALAAAIKPFAVAANSFDDSFDDEFPVMGKIIVRHLRRARAALAFTRKRSDRRPAR